jgi:hypothetical protein
VVLPACLAFLSNKLLSGPDGRTGVPPVLKQQRELTSGQHEPVEELLQPYAAFPKQVTGPTVWTREELVGEKGEARCKFPLLFEDGRDGRRMSNGDGHDQS